MVLPVLLDGQSLTIQEVVRATLDGAPVALTPGARDAVTRARDHVERLISGGQVVYGITTGFGYFKDRRIGPEAVEQLQQSLVLSHAAGVGEPLAPEVVRAMLVLRAQALARGHSGIRLETLDLLMELVNRRVHPLVPSQGSVGASGDLAPLSHMALALIGEGDVEVDGQVLPAREGLARRGLEPVRLAAKEGLALVNGTQAMTAMGCLAVHRVRSLARLADVACAMTLEATLGSNQSYRDVFHALRPHPGQQASARNLMRLTAQSDLIASHATCDRVQDAYSLRCAPQVHGASRDALAHAERVLTIEVNSVTDNPLLFPDSDEVLNGGHFHGQPVALALDFLAIACAEWASISERRIERLVNAQYSNGLPMFLAEDGGMNSGYMVAQYTAASLVSENKVLAHPACVDSIPTSAGQEDHVSMGTTSARKLLRVVDNLEKVLAIEIMCATQAIDLRGGLRPGVGPAAAHAAVRDEVPRLLVDRIVAHDIVAVARMVRTGGLLEAVERATGALD
ncbi:MAG: histidine ammonia-lyase [bacterium]|nr:histidine ammonia-lyase [bacterium]